MIYIDDDIFRLNAGQLEEAISILPDQRREVVMRYTHELGRRQSLLVYQLLCRGLQEEYGITEPPTFTYGEYGKPYLASHPDIHFNFSHSKTAVACAVSNRPIGIDIENFRPAKEAVIRYAMNEEEAAAILSASDPNLEFSRLWTQKEALLKLTGRGIHDNMRNILHNCHDAVIETTVTSQYVYSVAQFNS